MSTNTTTRRKASVDKNSCVACGACTKVCPKSAISIYKGCYATVNSEICVGCGLCANTCPAGSITIENGGADNEK